MDMDGERRMTRRIVTSMALVAVLALLAGCVGGIGASASTPKLSPPVIARPGVLRVVVDLTYPPFAGTVKGEKAGLDIDVAAAIADELGLKLVLINGTPTAGAALVKAGTADLVLGGLTVDQAVTSQITFAGTYVSDGPAVFAASDTTATMSNLASKRIAVQKNSAAYWALFDEYGDAPLIEMPTLLDALKAVRSGTADVAAGDAMVGAYMVRTLPTLKYLGQIGTASPLGVGVSATTTKAKIETEVRTILDRLAAEGVLTTLRRKWVGDLPTLKLPSLETTADISAAASSAASISSSATSPTP
jgi:polar amino acid transport system substrate-binding protein